jgi:hypothetical protein
MVFTLSIYIKLQQNEETNDALKKSTSGEKYYSLLPKNKQKTSLLKKQKLQMPYH